MDKIPERYVFSGEQFLCKQTGAVLTVESFDDDDNRWLYNLYTDADASVPYFTESGPGYTVIDTCHLGNPVKAMTRDDLVTAINHLATGVDLVCLTSF